MRIKLAMLSVIGFLIVFMLFIGTSIIMYTTTTEITDLSEGMGVDTNVNPLLEGFQDNYRLLFGALFLLFGVAFVVALVTDDNTGGGYGYQPTEYNEYLGGGLR